MLEREEGDALDSDGERKEDRALQGQGQGVGGEGGPRERRHVRVLAELREDVRPDLVLVEVGQAADQAVLREEERDALDHGQDAGHVLRERRERWTLGRIFPRTEF